MRLDKFLAHTTALTRSLAKQAIKQRRVHINGECAQDAGQIIHEHDRITLDDQPLLLRGARYLMLHKPAGYVCTREDAHHASIFSLIPDSDDLHAAGRLDADTTGLVLLSNDGQWSHRVTSPRKHCDKIYHVTLAQPLTADQAKQIEQGILLQGEDKPTRPAQLESLSPTQVVLTLHEGKYHQVKRMFAAVGNAVIALHRNRIGHITLDADVQPGHWRELSPAERDAF